MNTKTKIPLGQLLVENRVITQEQLDIALKKQKETGELLGAALLTLGFVGEESVFIPILAEQLGVEFVNLRNQDILKDTIAQIPAKFATYYKIMPIHFKEETLTVATTHPLDINIIDAVGLVAPYKVKTVLASEKDIAEAIRKYYGVGAETIDQMMTSVQIDRDKETGTENIEEIDSEASIGKFINQILLEAYKDRATDIHLEPYENDLKIRCRVDGVLVDARVPANIWHFKDSINSRIKIMSNLNIAEKRLPQDGRFQVKVGDVDLDLRVSFLPTQFGESVVIRILSSTKLYDMQDLGLSQKELQILDDLIRKPHGIIFVTGPTGSGKTTTLYSCLSKVNQSDRKIITIEDPIEYQLKGITQIQINPAVGLTFARGLRSMLRHDPDIMMVGEVRDLETAEIAIQIALTGHLVFSTLHTNDAVSGVTRLIDMGVEPYLITSVVECFVAQRLVRRICPKCKQSVKITPEMMKDFGLDEKNAGVTNVYEGKGCEHCNFTGYFGREGIYEFLLLNEKIEELILTRASASQIKNKAVSSGMKTLLEHGWEKVCRGITTPAEVLRVTTEKST
jgi:type II secretion system protein E